MKVYQYHVIIIFLTNSAVFVNDLKTIVYFLAAEKNKDGKCNQETITNPPITVDKILYMWDKKPN